jgi:hypothetical protein
MSNGGTGAGGGLPAAKAAAGGTMTQAGVGTGVTPCPAAAKPAAPPNVTVQILAADGTSTPCTIVPVNGQIQLKGVPSSGSGTYKWSTTSTKISLMNATSDTVTVVGDTTPSGGRDAETIKLVFTPSGAAALAPVTIGATVVSAVFSPSTSQSYGYDDMDDEAGIAPHVSVKKNDSTKVHIKLNGGITDADVKFKSDDTNIADAAPAGGGSDFEVTVNGKNQDKAETTIRVQCKCASASLLATILVDVYVEHAVTATVAKFYDSTVAATNLARANFDVKAAEAAINKWYKPAVAKITLTDNDPAGAAKPLHFDLNGNGTLDLEPGGTSAEQAAITAAFNPTGQKVIIVKDLAWIYYLKTAASKDATTITLKDSYSDYMKFIVAGDSYTLGAGASAETIQVRRVRGQTVTLQSPLTNDHPVTEGLIWPLSGLSGDPIFVAEQTKTEDKERQTIGHENGHSLMEWLDLEASKNLMHYSISRTDTEVRFKGLPRKYDSGDENQWDTLSRPTPP